MNTATLASDFCALILAAGLSSRMGRFKPLLPLGEVCVVRRVIDLFRQAEVAEIQVVTGHRAEELSPAVKAAGGTPVENPHYAEGMFSSIQAGLRRVPDRCRGVFILPVDIPLVRPATLRLLMEAFRRHPQGTTVHPCFQGLRGHPPLVPAGLIPAILDHDGHGGLRTLLEAPDARAVEVPVPDRYIIEDMDRPERYEALLRELPGYAIPDEAECEALLDTCRGGVQRHSRLVAAGAGAIGAELGLAGVGLNPKLLQAGALLHDIAKGQKGHARAGARYLERLGFGQVAAIVAQHDNLEYQPGDAVNEAAVVFLVDKHISGERPVSIEERFAEAMARFGDHPEARHNIARRKHTARRVRDRIETLTGKTVSGLIRAAVRTAVEMGIGEPAP